MATPENCWKNINKIIRMRGFRISGLFNLLCRSFALLQEQDEIFQSALQANLLKSVLVDFFFCVAS